LRVRSGLIALCCISVGSAPAIAAPADDGIRLRAVAAQLYYERSGTLSEDLIARDPPFTGWNTVIGEGDASEPSEYLLVSAVLANPGDEAFLDEKLTIRVTGEKGKKIRERVFSGMLIAHRGSLRLPLWIDDAGCLGAITITATFRKQKVSAPLQLMCGE